MAESTVFAITTTPITTAAMSSRIIAPILPRSASTIVPQAVVAPRCSMSHWREHGMAETLEGTRSDPEPVVAEGSRVSYVEAGAAPEREQRPIFDVPARHNTKLQRLVAAINEDESL